MSGRRHGRLSDEADPARATGRGIGARTSRGQGLGVFSNLICHAERSEESMASTVTPLSNAWILREAQNDGKNGFQRCEAPGPRSAVLAGSIQLRAQC